MVQKPKSLLFPIALVMYEIATYLSNDMYLPALPQMMDELGLDTKAVQLTLTSWFLGSASMPLVMGAISDRFGRRLVLLSGGIIYITMTILCALATSQEMLLAVRLMQGGMVSTMMVSGYAAIHELYEQKEAVRILALMGSIVIIAPALGPLFGAIVLELTNWRGIFWLIALWATVTILLLYYCMPETLTPEMRQPLHLRSLMQKYLRLLTNKNFMILLFILGFIFCGFLSWVTSGSLLIIENFHYSALIFGILQAVVFSVNILGNYCVRYFVNLMDVQNLIRLGLAINLCGSVAMIAIAIYFPLTLSGFISAMLVYSFGSGLCFAPLNRTAIEASNEPMGARVALFTVFLTGFAAVGSTLSSLFFSGTIASLAWIIAVPGIVGFLIKLLWYK